MKLKAMLLRLCFFLGAGGGGVAGGGGGDGVGLVRAKYNTYSKPSLSDISCT